MFTNAFTLLRNRKALVGVRLLLFLLSATVMVVYLQKDEDASKREQKLQIDVAFIIHGSKNITSPPRKETFKEALGWAKKIIEAFGEIGINKTRAGLILYAEKPKLMFNFTEKLEKGEVLGALDEAGSPPAIGNKTFTGKALKLALKTLVTETREEALKKFFVFSDRPPEDDPMAPASAIEGKKVDLYGLGKTTAPYKDWYITDYSLDSMYAMLKAGPFKGRKAAEKDKTFQDELSKIKASSNRLTQPSATKINPIVTTTTSNQNKDIQNGNGPPSGPQMPTSKVSPTPSASKNLLNPGNTIAGVISNVLGPEKDNLAKNNYGNDASVVVTVNSLKTGTSVGRYSTASVGPYKSTDFGTVIGGLKLKGQSQFSVVKPGSQDSNLRSKVGNSQLRRRAYKWFKRRQKYNKLQ